MLHNGDHYGGGGGGVLINGAGPGHYDKEDGEGYGAGGGGNGYSKGFPGVVVVAVN